MGSMGVAGKQEAIKPNVVQISTCQYSKILGLLNLERCQMGKKMVLEKAVSYKVRNKGGKGKHALGIPDYSGSGVLDIKRKFILREIFT